MYTKNTVLVDMYTLIGLNKVCMYMYVQLYMQVAR